jgi:hypothetical protein
MILVTALFVATATLAAAAEGAPSVPAEKRMSSTEGMAAEFGHTLGAASQCETIDKGRLDAAMAKARALFGTAHGGGSDRVALRFESGLSSGREDVLNGAMSCREVEAALQSLERQTGS